jgi:hypothetical protein
MQNPFQPNLRKPWLLLCVTALMTYAILPVTHAPRFNPYAASNLLEVLMFLLAFPLGDLALLTFDSQSFFESYSSGIGERFVRWGLALLVGYVQWFHLVPALLARRRPAVTTLNLSPDDMVASAPAAAPVYAPGPRPEKQLNASSSPPVPQFDARGLTPLERIIAECRVQNDE